MKTFVVIGNGLGGLATAAYLSKQGWQGQVLEQHGQPGGSIVPAGR